jgi:diguanylate cyclase
MYMAKRGGGNGHQVMDPAARLAADRRHDLERDLAKAESTGQLELLYQPILHAGTGALTAVEALLRWNHPERGLVMPEVIVPSAERTGLIRSIGEWVLRQACGDLRVWTQQGVEVPRVSVNVSAHQLMGPAYAAAVRRVLEDTGVNPAGLRLEVTESVFLADAPRSLLVMHELRDLGVGLSLDDFGTGYSSLSYLRQFPFDAVKIDRRFVADLLEDEVNRAIVSAMVDLSHVLGLVVTVEGVETPEQLAEVTALGADHVQGFHLAPPLRSDEVAERFRRSP